MFAPVTVRRSLSRAARAHAPEDAQARGDRVPVLDGLRGLAIILVFLAHAIREPLQPGTASIDVALRAIAYTGWIGVDLFFVLSGFLISGILLDTRGQPRWWPNFIVRRALRIFPLYYGALTVLFVFLPWLVRWSNPDFVTLQANQRWYWTYTVNLLAALTDGRGTPLYTSHLWSLSIEEQFYLIWPFFVWVCRPRTLLRVAARGVLANAGSTRQSHDRRRAGRPCPVTGGPAPPRPPRPPGTRRWGLCTLCAGIVPGRARRAGPRRSNCGLSGGRTRVRLAPRNGADSASYRRPGPGTELRITREVGKIQLCYLPRSLSPVGRDRIEDHVLSARGRAARRIAAAVRPAACGANDGAVVSARMAELSSL